MAKPSKYDDGQRWPTRWPERAVRMPALPPVSEWQRDAACAGQDVEAFTEATDQTAGGPLSARWCSRCPVADECGRYGVQTRAWGLWGGGVLIDGRPAPVVSP
ncbi:MAG: Transcription factor WhiB [Friedmanniella sp.]|nr:Transcription factor WhiB [Friedmanniella sp.]